MALHPLQSSLYLHSWHFPFKFEFLILLNISPVHAFWIPSLIFPALIFKNAHGYISPFGIIVALIAQAPHPFHIASLDVI